MKGAVSENEVLIGGIFQSSSHAVGVTREGVYRLVNPAYARMFGYDAPDEIVGRSILDLVAPEERARVGGTIRRRERGDETPGPYVTRGLRRDGSTFDIEVDPSFYELGGERYTLGIVRDVTEQLRAANTLREGHELYRALFEHNTAIKLLMDPETVTLVDVNDAAAAFYGYPRERMRGMPLSQLNPMPAEELRPAMQAIVAGSLRSFTIPHRLADGRIRMVEAHSGPVRVGGRTLNFAILHDVTDRAELEAQLRQAQKMEAVGQLAGGIAHDFNNLLTVVAGHAELLERRAGTDAAVRDHAKEIRRQAARAEELTRQLLAFSRRQVMQPRVIDLAAIVAETEGLVRRLVGERVHVTIDAPAGQWVASDPSQVQQVVMNLVVNARDAMPDGGAVGLRVYTRQDPPGSSATPPGDWVILEVQDTGTGMDAATRARAFEPFFTTKEKGKGTGLGLATVYGIVTQSGGVVDVRSEPGQGATFTVRLPRVPAPAAVAEAPRSVPSFPPITKDRSRFTVLLAEDDDSVRVFLRERLSLMGYRVLAARDGAEALEIARTSGARVDVLVTDVVMPRMNGPQLHAALAPEMPDLKVVFMSGYADGLLSREQLEAAGGRFLAKPFTGRALEAVLNTLLTD